RALLRHPQVEYAADAVRAEHRHALVRQVAVAVGADQRAQADPAAARGRQAADIARVVATRPVQVMRDRSVGVVDPGVLEFGVLEPGAWDPGVLGHVPLSRSRARNASLCAGVRPPW